MAKVPYTNEIVAFSTSNIVFLPQLRGSYGYNAELNFFDDLILAIEKINKGKDVIELPIWAKNYSLPNENTIVRSIETVEKEIELKMREKEAQENLLRVLNDRKILFTGTGSVLEESVGKIFLELGFELLEPDDSRDDLILKYNGNIAVVEVKGVSGSAAEKHAAQLEKWVSNYYEKYEVLPKGILLENPFKDTELKDRKEIIWPPQMQGYSVQRKHCLLTTIQLLGIYFEIQKDASKKEELIKSIFETVGIYQGYDKWNDFIEVKS